MPGGRPERKGAGMRSGGGGSGGKTSAGNRGRGRPKKDSGGTGLTPGACQCVCVLCLAAATGHTRVCSHPHHTHSSCDTPFSSHLTDTHALSLAPSVPQRLRPCNNPWPPTKKTCGCSVTRARSGDACLLKRYSRMMCHGAFECGGDVCGWVRDVHLGTML